MRTTTVVLDGVEYVLQEKRARENRAWRGELEGHFSDVAAVLDNDVDTGSGLASVVRVISGKVLGMVDVVVDLVRSYAPELPLDEAYESEIIEVFWGVLGLAYPFGFEALTKRILGRVQRISERESTTQN